MSDVPLTTNTWVEIDLDQIRHNIQNIRHSAGSIEVVGVIKADAYGHGVERIGPVLYDEGLRWFAVGSLAEGIQLRAILEDDASIIVFAAPVRENVTLYARSRLDILVSSPDAADAIIAYNGSETLRAHLKIETGMGRLGLTPAQADRYASTFRHLEHVELVGVATHLATADEDDLGRTEDQLDQFDRVIRATGLDDLYVHAANSEALLRLNDRLSAYNLPLARIGIALYGCPARDETRRELDVKPAMRLLSRVVHVKSVEPGTAISYGWRWRAPRQTRIATLGTGYGDGYPRILMNRAQVGINGRLYPVVGTVCMDMMMVDLGPDDTDGRQVQTGELAVLFGKGGPDVSDVADWAETISYEICARISARVPKLYVGK